MTDQYHDYHGDEPDENEERQPVGVFILNVDKMSELHLALTELKHDNPGSPYFLDTGMLEQVRLMAESWLERQLRGGQYDA